MSDKCSASTMEKCKALFEGTYLPLEEIQRPEDKVGGIYAIKEGGKVIYVGRSKDIRKRLRDHFSGDQDIDNHIKKASTGPLTYNYVRDPCQECTEHCYVDGIGRLQGERPKFNKQKGDSCDKGQCTRK